MNNRTSWHHAGAWLRDLRKTAGITQRELAEQVGAPGARLVEEIEAGKMAVPVAFHRGYARTFGISVAEFAKRCAAYYGAGENAIDAAA